jgi:hypothetical protein
MERGIEASTSWRDFSDAGNSKRGLWNWKTKSCYRFSGLTEVRFNCFFVVLTYLLLGIEGVVYRHFQSDGGIENCFVDSSLLKNSTQRHQSSTPALSNLTSTFSFPRQFPYSSSDSSDSSSTSFCSSNASFSISSTISSSSATALRISMVSSSNVFTRSST